MNIKTNTARTSKGSGKEGMGGWGKKKMMILETDR
jgi:hypothetical protein